MRADQNISATLRSLCR